MNGDMLELVARRFRLLGEPVRLRILQILESGERSVNELTESLQSTQPNVSRHLAALFEGNLLKRRRVGNNIYYSVADPIVFRLCELVCGSEREKARLQLTALVGSPDAKGSR